ncbi:MAG: MFS transporter [Alicyclobacillus sp.]|nr:MFS transporter [Alicyclobacillus sp.]
MDTRKNAIDTRWIRLLPALVMVYMIAFLDKSLVSFAIAGGMSKDLGMTASVTGFMSGIFSFGYLLLEIPGGYMAANGKAKTFLTFSIAGWGVFGLLSGTASTVWQAVLYRFLLGIAEGAIFPALAAIIGNWFAIEERARAFGVLYTSTAISQIIMGPLAGLVLSHYTWHELYYFDGFLSLLVVPIWLWLVAEKPDKAHWLSDSERARLSARIQLSEERAVVNNEPTQLNLRQVIRNLNIWKVTFIYFEASLGTIGLATWYPTMIKEMTKLGIAEVGLLSVIPNVCVLVGVLMFGAFTDKLQKRRLMAGGPQVLFTGGILLSMELHQHVILSFVVFCIGMFFLLGHAPAVWSIVSSLFAGSNRGSAGGLMQMGSGVGSFFGPWLIGYFIQLTGGLSASWMVMLAVSLLGLVVAYTLPRSLDRKVRIATEVITPQTHA